MLTGERAGFGRASRAPIERRLDRMLAGVQLTAVLGGAAPVVAAHGSGLFGPSVRRGLEVLFPALAAFLMLLAPWRWRLDSRRGTFFGDHPAAAIIIVLTLAVAVILALVSEESLVRLGLDGRPSAFRFAAELAIIAWLGETLLSLFRRVSLARVNPALVLVLSFAGLIALGTALLMLPRATALPGRAPLLTAFFTATSAACVTGLTVEDTGTYWSVEGQWVILALIQVGGLGIMTFGAFVALASGQGLLVSQSVLLGDVFETKMLSRVRRLVLAIIGFTLVSEVVGVALLESLWAHLPPGERLRHGIFHSVSAFSNAGFSLQRDSMVGLGGAWQVWGVLSGLVILGGMGFATLYNVLEVGASRLARPLRRPLFHDPRPRPRLNVTSRLALLVTAVLLAAGAVGLLICEWAGAFAGRPWPERLAGAWFQSVTCRTAGFNTLRIEDLSEASQFLLIVLMFIGASPGSTGGGIRTVAMATVILSLFAVLRGRSRVEVFRRTIPDPMVRRALLIGALGTAVVAATTMLLVAIEGRPGSFLACLFEATSAFATVGLSTGMTPELSAPGKCLIACTMFIGRLGPLTLLLALAERTHAERYRYPDEVVSLG
jgi:trk system potassium uptake protein TrkH